MESFHPNLIEILRFRREENRYLVLVTAALIICAMIRGIIAWHSHRIMRFMKSLQTLIILPPRALSSIESVACPLKVRNKPSINPRPLSSPIERCVICLEPMHFAASIGKSIGRLTICSHHFHRKCISTWLKDNPHSCVCPICRRPFGKSNIKAIPRKNSFPFRGKIRQTLGAFARNLRRKIK